MRERDKEFSKAIDEIVKGIETSLKNPQKYSVIKRRDRKD